MKYFLLLAGDDATTGPFDELTPEQQGEEMAKHDAFSTACEAGENTEILGGDALMPGSMATTISSRSGTFTVTDGPYAEAAEQIGGYYVVEAPDLDTVVELCRLLPAYDIDIRPVLEFD